MRGNGKALRCKGVNTTTSLALSIPPHFGKHEGIRRADARSAVMSVWPHPCCSPSWAAFRERPIERPSSKSEPHFTNLRECRSRQCQRLKPSCWFRVGEVLQKEKDRLLTIAKVPSRTGTSRRGLLLHRPWLEPRNEHQIPQWLWRAHLES